jgi:hypothetical protein
MPQQYVSPRNNVAQPYVRTEQDENEYVAHARMIEARREAQRVFLVARYEENLKLRAAESVARYAADAAAYGQPDVALGC